MCDIPAKASSHEECDKEYEVKLESDVLGKLDRSLGSLQGSFFTNDQYYYFYRFYLFI